MIFFRKKGTLYNLIDNLIKDVQKTSDVKLKYKILRSILEIRWTQNYHQEAQKINALLESKGEKVRLARLKYKDEKLALERAKQDTKLVDAKLEVLDILMEGAE